MAQPMRARVFVVALAIFAGAAALGGAFALLGPIKLIRIFGAIAFLAAAIGCALQIYALHEFAPRAYDLLRDRAMALWRRVGWTPAVVSP